MITITSFSAETTRSGAQALRKVVESYGSYGARVLEFPERNTAEIYADGDHAQRLLMRAIASAPLRMKRLAMSLETTAHESPDIAESIVGHAAAVHDGVVVVFGRKSERIIASVILSDERLMRRALRAWENRTTMYAVEEAFMASLLPYFDEAPWNRLVWRSYYALTADSIDPPDAVTTTTVGGVVIAVVRRKGRRVIDGTPPLDEAFVEFSVGDAGVSIASPCAGRWDALIERNGGAKRIVAPNLAVLGTNVEAELRGCGAAVRLRQDA